MSINICSTHVDQAHMCGFNYKNDSINFFTNDIKQAKNKHVPCIFYVHYKDQSIIPRCAHYEICNNCMYTCFSQCWPFCSLNCVVSLKFLYIENDFFCATCEKFLCYKV